MIKQENERFQEFRDKHGGKKICILYGNCHMTAIRDILQSVPEFTKLYAIFPIKAIQDIKSTRYFQCEVFYKCDIFIHQSIQFNNRYGSEYASENIIKQLKPGCQVISVPNLYHLPMCFFPQYTEEKEFVWGGGTVFFRDMLLDFAYSRGYTLQQTLDLYTGNIRPNEVWGLINLDAMFNSFIQKIKIREEAWNIKIADYILKNYRSQQLFFDPNHPTPTLIKQISKGILNHMNVRFNQEHVDTFNDLRIDTYEMPICSVVREHFHMIFPQVTIRLTGSKVIQVPMDLKWYIKQYWSMEWQNEDLSFVKRASSYLHFIMYKVYNQYLKLKKQLEKNRKLR